MTRQGALMGYKLCRDCGSPVLKRGQKRKHSDDYRHASGCRFARGKYYQRLAWLESWTVAERLSDEENNP